MEKNYIKNLQEIHHKAFANARKMSKQEIRNIFKAMHKFAYNTPDNKPFNRSRTNGPVN